ncbi:hypothetical protein CPC08DRAFT_441468 [Agrocybe pediades]|nr:hypothetical protein CPC08DRAFT_441468 [Agrocybe pediades]
MLAGRRRLCLTLGIQYAIHGAAAGCIIADAVFTLLFLRGTFQLFLPWAVGCLGMCLLGICQWNLIAWNTVFLQFRIVSDPPFLVSCFQSELVFSDVTLCSGGSPSDLFCFQVVKDVCIHERFYV